MKRDYIATFVTTSDLFVDEKVFSASSISDAEDMAEKYMEENEYIWLGYFPENMFYCLKIEELENV